MACALEIQRTSNQDGAPAGLRIGLHSDDRESLGERGENEDVIGRASHICGLAHGGQTLLGRSTHDLVADHLPTGAELRDLGRQRLRDLSHIENVWQLCHPDLTDAFPSLRSLDAVPNNLPIQTTTFIGREREASDVRHQLTTTRLLTITGAGGCGKTRLSFEAATTLLDTFPDGVWWVDLASISDPALVAKTVASALSVQEIPNQPILQTLTRTLQDRQLLIMLDNCEHVIEASAELAQTLISTTHTPSLLATSREPLGVGGEVTFRIPSLTFPPDPPPATIDSLSQYEAVRLFIDRALRAQPDFRATNETAPAIAEICHRLDGIPLAIELAAARTRVLTPDQIAAGLGDVFHVLTSGARTSLPRQRTIEASIDWSHELLAPDERVLFRRISVFAGGFTLEAVESVCSGGGIDSSEILDLLTGLLDKSLVQLDNEPSGARFRLLETIRHYAGRMLTASGEAGAIRTRHLDHMVLFAERAEQALETTEHAGVVKRIDPEMDNIRAALEWSLEQPDAGQGLRLAGALWLFWEARGVAEGLSWARALLARETPNQLARAMVVFACSELSLTMGDPVASVAFADEAVKLGRDLGDTRLLARSLTFAGIARNFLEPANAHPYLEESIELGRAIGYSYILSEALTGLGLNALLAGSPPRARDLFIEARAAATQAGNPVLVSRAAMCFGWALLELTDLSGARDALSASNRIATDMQARFWMNLSRCLLATIDMLEGSVEHARDESMQALNDAIEIVSGFGLAIAGWCVGQGARAVGDFDSAPRVFDQALPMQLATGLRWLGAWSLASHAELDVENGETASANAHIEEAQGILRETPNPVAHGHVHLARASVAIAGDDLEAAENAIHEALQLFAASKHQQGLVDAIERLAWILARLESYEEATRLMGAAHSTRSFLGYVRFPADVVAFEEAEDLCRNALGPEAFDVASAEGAELSLEEVITYASRGRGSRKRPSAGWASLTPAEHDVVRLVAEGLTNAAIGKRLFISPRTVQAHLARVFGKLGVGSRTELAAEAIKRGSAVFS